LTTHSEAAEFANIRPFLRWAGSKRLLLKYLIPFIPSNIRKYYEPFLGGGAMFFFIGPASAEISDASGPLIDTYKSVRSEADEVLAALNGLLPDKVTFDRIRREKPTTAFAKAAQFIFLNKACWNGLYRVNSEGIFNVPFGRPRSDFIVNADNFRRCARQLARRSVSLRQQDFGAIADRVSEGDFVFLDPPYVTAHNLNGFIDWNEALFSWEDQIRLAAMARALAWRGANVLITNADHKDIRELYAGFGRRTFVRSSTLASNTTKRKRTSEAIFFSGPSYTPHFVRRLGRQHLWI
jgi:DNA adenine methylase